MLFQGRILLLFMLFCSQVSAYEPEAVHKVIAQQALHAYQRCYPDDATYRDKKIQQRIIQGNIAMDEGLETSFIERLHLHEEQNLFRHKRIHNWHFYNQQRQHLSKAGLIEQSMKNLWQGVMRGLKNNTDIYDKSLFIGALMHLLEDLTVPAHIVPVYHGPTVIKILGPIQLAPLVDYMLEVKAFSYMQDDKGMQVIKDSIDNLHPDQSKLLVEIDSDILCDTIEQLSITSEPLSISLEQLRDQQASFTLAFLETPIPACDGFQWSHFWLKPEGNHYFGRYNIGMQQPLFGESGKLVAGKKYCDFVKDDDRYQDFIFALHIAAIKADVVLLRWASQNYFFATEVFISKQKTL